MAKATEEITKNVEVIKEATTLLPEDMPEETRKLWGSIPDRVEDALGLIEDGDIDSNRKLALITDATSKYANQICFYLFRGNLLTDDLAKKFRSLRTPEETTKDIERHEAIMKKVEDDLLKDRDALIARNDAYELIQAVLGGYSVEEAKNRIQAEKEKAARAFQPRG